MQILKSASCGTVESSDVMVLVEKGSNGIEIELSSPVARAFDEDILKTVKELTEQMGVKNAKITLNDHGALDCTLRARLECALLRAGEAKND